VMHTRDFMFMSVCVCVCIRDVDMALILFIVIDNVLYTIWCTYTCNFHLITPNRVS